MILDLETLGDALGHLNMPKDIGKLDFQDFRDIRDIGLGDIGRCFGTSEYPYGYWEIQFLRLSGYSGS